MNIKKDFIKKTKEYLEDLRKKINRKNMLNDEIKLLKERESLNGGINFNELYIKSRPGTKDISDMIISYDTQITLRESEIDKIDSDLRMFELKSRELNALYKTIINLRYLNSNKKITFDKIAKDIGYSSISIRRKHDDAIDLLAYYIYGEDATYS